MTSTAVVDSENPASSCAICFGTFSTTPQTNHTNSHREVHSSSSSSSNVKHVPLACCERETTTTKFCIACINLLCQHTNYGNQNIGRCPRCRSYIQVVVVEEDNKRKESIIRIVNPPIEYTCRICQQSFSEYQVRQVRQRGGGGRAAARMILCHACVIGVQNPMRYECQSCGILQRISHPMYRYQPSPDEFSDRTWACRSRHCHQDVGYTHWKIGVQDLHRIPLEDIPERWNWDRELGVQEAIVAVRRIREHQRRRNDVVDLNGNHHRLGMTTTWVVGGLAILIYFYVTSY